MVLSSEHRMIKLPDGRTSSHGRPNDGQRHGGVSNSTRGRWPRNGHTDVAPPDVGTPFTLGRDEFVASFQRLSAADAPKPDGPSAALAAQISSDARTPAAADQPSNPPLQQLRNWSTGRD